MQSKIRSTKEGKIFFVFSILVLLSALHTGVNLIYVTFSILFGALVISYLQVKFVGNRVEVRCLLASAVTVGQSFIVKLTIKNRSAWLPAFCMSMYRNWPKTIESDFDHHLVLRIKANVENSYRFQCQARCRGKFSLQQPTFGTSFPFGFFERINKSSESKDLLVYPRIGTLLNKQIFENSGRGQFSHQRRLKFNDSDEFFGLREYRPGDNPRWIHWRTSARLQKPMLKEHVGQIQEEHLLILLMFEQPEKEIKDNDPFEKGISLIATIANALYTRNCNLAFASFNGEMLWVPFDQGQRQYHRILRQLAILRPVAVESLEHLLGRKEFSNLRTANTITVTVGATTDQSTTITRSLNQKNCATKQIEVTAPDFDRNFVLNYSEAIEKKYFLNNSR